MKVYPAIVQAPLAAPFIVWLLSALDTLRQWLLTGRIDPYWNGLENALLMLYAYFLYGAPLAYAGTSLLVVPGLLALDYKGRLQQRYILPLGILAATLTGAPISTDLPWLLISALTGLLCTLLFIHLTHTRS